jgi:hypothetical protein
LAARPELRALRLDELADEVTGAYRRGAAWEDTVQLDNTNIDVLRRYDDLVRERVRRMRDGMAEPAALTRELRQAIDQRDDLLRGRRPPSLEPSALLRSGGPRRGAEALERLHVGDAVSRGRDDYVVDAVAEYFDEGKRWRIAKLTPSGADAPAHWLYVGPAAQEVALLEEVSASAQNQGNTAVVDVDSRSGKAEGVLVSYTRVNTGSTLTFEEGWPDGTERAYSGALIDPGELDVWPAFNP